MFLTMLEGPSWEASRPCLNVPEILQIRVTAQAFNDATKYGPHCELFYFLMKHEQKLTEPHVSTESLFFHVPFRPLGSTASRQK